MTGSFFSALGRAFCLLACLAVVAAGPVSAQGWQPLTGTPGSGGGVTPPSQPMPPSGYSPAPGIPQWTTPHQPQPVHPTQPTHPAPPPASGGHCAATIAASPATAETGDTVTLTVTVPAAFRSKVGRVTITGPEGPVSASGGNGVYRHWWAIPANFTGRGATFSFEAVGRYGDLYGQFPVLCSGSTTVSVGKALNVALSGPEAGLPGYQRTFGATAQGGKAPYTFAWTVDGADAGTRTDNRASSVGKTFSLKGEHVIAVAVTDAAGRQASATKRHRVYELGVKISGPTKLEVGKTGSWAATTASPFGPYEFTFTWEDGSRHGTISTRNPKASASHNYEKPRRYRITASVWDGKDTDFGELYVDVTDPSLGDTVEVPEVEGWNVDKAVKEIKDLGLHVVVSWTPPRESEHAFRVFETVPEARTKLKKGKTVEVHSYDKYRDLMLPNVVGMPLEKAKKTLTDAHFRVEAPNLPANPPAPRQDLAGAVRKQIPEGGYEWPPGTPVELLVWGPHVPEPNVPAGLTTETWAGAWDCSRHTAFIHYSVPMELTITGKGVGSSLSGMHRRTANAGGDAGPYAYTLKGTKNYKEAHGTVTYREKPDKPLRFRGTFTIKLSGDRSMSLSHNFEGQDKPHSYSCERK